ncbi:ComF family protein [Paraburkholderia phymatum]|uniref:Putative competence protein F-related protein n=1 Tax=Paraburkholderia phymatum (strain DSM 17167 / CIP 108236 / LMG 21445 / STM815) TaxID=391038 RepID=B2JCA2_PARP8|nr:ComF family protein [Paraburkholderia phymatum]ACC69466.1 putative competence protein F-related protein [Paraburkholderia phymatum STM815]
MPNRAFRWLGASRLGRSLQERVSGVARRSVSAWPALAHLALPNSCALCGNMSHQTLCCFCDEAWWNQARLRCTVCAVPLSGFRRASLMHYRCGDCLATPPAFDATVALADYRAPLDALAVGLKFRARLALANEFARRLAWSALDALDERDRPDVVAPVPLSARRLVERGYNQAWEIARPCAKALGVRSDATLVRRVVDTAPQSKLDLDARRQNVGRAFVVATRVRGLHVAIVDDVMTTGATLDALARTLKAAGARRVTNLVALRTPKN